MADRQNRDFKYSPVIDGLGLAPTAGRLPCWVCSVVEDKRGKKRVALGVLTPGLLTRAQAMDLSVRLAQLVQGLGPEGD